MHYAGNYFDQGSIYIDLRNNKLTRFESGVFQSNDYIIGTVYLFDSKNVNTLFLLSY